MKCRKAEVNRAGRKLRRLGASSLLALLALLTLMILSLSSGRLLAADDFNLWQLRGIGQQPVLLKHVTDDESEKSVKWLLTDPSEQSEKKFVAAFKGEPFKFVEGFKAAMLKAIETDKLESFKKTAENLKKIDPKAFGKGARASAFKQIIDALLEKSKDDLKKEDLLKELFDDPSLRALLALVDQDPEASPTPTNLPDPNLDLITKQLEELGKKGDESRKQAEADRNAADERVRLLTEQMKQQQQVQTKPRGQQTPTGELNDKDLAAIAQPICDHYNAARRASNDAYTDLKKQFNAFADVLASESRQPDRTNFNKAENKSQLEDILPQLITDSLKKNNNNQTTPPPQPQLAQQAATTQPQNGKNVFDQPLPPQPQQGQQQMPFMPFFQQPYQNTGAQQPVNLNLPAATAGQSTLRDAQDTADYNESMRKSAVTGLTAQSDMMDLLMAKAQVQSDEERTRSSLQDAKAQKNELDDQISYLEKGAEAALPDDVKQKKAQLQADLDAKKSRYSQMQSQLGMLAMSGQNPMGNSYFMYQGMMLQNQIAQAQSAVNNYNTQVEIAVQNGNNQIKRLAKTRDNLRSVVSKLQGQLGSMSKEEDTVEQIVNTNKQLQMAALQAPARSNGTPNVNKIMNYGGRGGNRPPSSRLGGLSPAANAGNGGGGTGGGTMRGPLGSSKGSL